MKKQLIVIAIVYRGASGQVFIRSEPCLVEGHQDLEIIMDTLKKEFPENCDFVTGIFQAIPQEMIDEINQL